MRIGLRKANQQFSSVIKAVKAGQEVVLTERGRPIAVVKPIRKAATAEEILKRLEAIGLLWPAAKRTPMPPCKPLRLRAGPITKTLRQERDLS